MILNQIITLNDGSKKDIILTMYIFIIFGGVKERAFEVFNIFQRHIKNSLLNHKTSVCKWTVTDIEFFLEDDKGTKYIGYAWEPLH